MPIHNLLVVTALTVISTALFDMLEQHVFSELLGALKRRSTIENYAMPCAFTGLSTAEVTYSGQSKAVLSYRKRLEGYYNHECVRGQII